MNLSRSLLSFRSVNLSTFPAQLPADPRPPCRSPQRPVPRSRHLLISLTSPLGYPVLSPPLFKRVCPCTRQQNNKNKNHPTTPRSFLCATWVLRVLPPSRRPPFRAVPPSTPLLTVFLAGGIILAPDEYSSIPFVGIPRRRYYPRPRRVLLDPLRLRYPSAEAGRCRLSPTRFDELADSRRAGDLCARVP